MKNWQKGLITAAVLPGMGMLGALTGLFLPTAPVITGLVAALLAAAVRALGKCAAVCVGLSFCVGVAIVCGVAQPGLMALAGWYALFLLVGGVAGCVALKRGKTGERLMKLFCVMMVFGLVSYVGCNLATGDVVAYATGLVQQELAEMERLFPPLYDMLLSTLSVYGMLSDVGLESAVYALDATTREMLTASFVEIFDSSLRLGLIRMLAEQALHFSLMFLLADLMAKENHGKLEKLSRLLRVGPGLSMILMLGLVVLMVLSVFVDAAYPIYMMWSALFNFTFMVQGMALAEWFLRRREWKDAQRWIVIGLGYVALPYVLFLLGFVEQIIGFRRIAALKAAGVTADEVRDALFGEGELPLPDAEKELAEEDETDEDESEDDDPDDDDKE